jgi:hypothetical protein
MRFFVFAHGKLGHVATQRILRKLNANLRTTAASLLPLEQFKIPHIGNEVRLPSSSRVPGSGAAKVVCLGVEAVRKSVLTIKYEISVVKQIDHAGRTGYG